MQTLCSTEGSISSFCKIETRNQRQQHKVLQEHNSSPELEKRSASFTFSNLFVPVTKSSTPLPELDWADAKEVWSVMLRKDRQCTRNPLYIRRHSHLQPRMRAILLDWLIEVCGLFKPSYKPLYEEDTQAFIFSADNTFSSNHFAFESFLCQLRHLYLRKVWYA